MHTSTFLRFSFGSFLAFMFLLTGASLAQATGESSQIQGVYPTGAINPGTMVNFVTLASGFTDPVYTLTDAFSATGATVGTLDKVGYFTWTPGIYDAGRHAITVVVTDSRSHSATSTVNILVASNSILLNSLSPGSTVSARQPITFSIVAPGFTTPNYTVYDSYSMSSVNSGNINASGAFSWTPTLDDVGVHLLTIGASDSIGHNAQTIQKITVNPLVSATVTSSTTVSTTASSTTATTRTSTSTTPSTVTSSVTQAPTTTAAAKKYIFTTNLAIGSRGTAVLELQKRLTTLGFFTGATSNYFGPLTAASVKKFQDARGLPRVGNVGPATRAALNK